MNRRIFLALAVIAAAAIVSFGIPLAYAVQRFYRGEETLRLQQLATVAGRSVPSPPSNDPIELPPVANHIELTSYNSSGKLTAGKGPSSPDAATRAALQGHLADTETNGRMVAAVPILTNEEVVAVIRADEPLDVIDGRVHRAWVAMGGLALLVVGGAVALSRIVASRITRPVRAVQAAAVRLGDGDFTITVPRSNVAELDDVAEALEATAARLDVVLQRERAFSADASHQLKTPITSLRLLVENELAYPDPEPVRAFTTALQYIDQLEATVTNLLALARDVAQPVGAADVDEVFAGLEARWHGAAAAQGRLLRMSSDATEPIEASSRALNQVLDVLLENALSHGRGTISVIVQSVEHGSIICVSDEGAGVTGSPEEIFRRRASGHGGTGIGLALARSLTEAEGGRLTLTRAAPHPEFTIAFRRTTARL